MFKNLTLLFLVSLITLSCSQRFTTSTIESRNLEDLPDQEITIESGDIVDDNIISSDEVESSEPELTTLDDAENSVIDNSANSSVDWSLLNNDELLKIRSFYVNGKLDGEYLLYDEQGRLRGKSFYKNGKLEGEHLHYNKKGLLLEKRIYKNGILIEVKPNTE